MNEPKDNLEGMITALTVFAKYLPDGLESAYVLSNNHGIIYIDVDNDDLPEDSEDGRLLIKLGWHVDNMNDNWAYFT